MKKQNRVALFNILSIVLVNGISIFTAPVFSRLLGDSGYGVVSIYTIWNSAIAIVFALQTQGTLVNARVEYSEEEQRNYHASAMALSVLAFTLFSTLVLLFMEPVSSLLNLEPRLIRIMLLQAFGTFCVNFLTVKFVYEYKAGWNMLISMGITVTNLVLSLVMVLWVYPQQPYMGRILAMATTYVIFGIPACLYVLISGRMAFRLKYWKFCLVLAIPSVCYNISDLLQGQIDRVMLQRMMDDAAVGQYSLALNFAGVLFLLYGALNNSWCPFFLDDKKEGREDAVRQRAANFLELFTVLCTGFILLTREVYHVFASREYWVGTNLIPIFALGYYLNFLCTFPINYEYYHKKTKVVAAVTVISSVTNVCLNYILIRKMGMMGAAIATTVSHGFQLAMHYGYARFVLDRKNYPFGIGLWGKYLAAFAAVMAVVAGTQSLWLVRWGLGAAVGIWELLRIKKRKVLI